MYDFAFPGWPLKSGWPVEKTITMYYHLFSVFFQDASDLYFKYMYVNEIKK